MPLNGRFVCWLAPGIVTFSLVFPGCQKQEKSVPDADPAPVVAPAGHASAGVSAVATEPTGREVSPGSSPATEGSKTSDKQEAGTKTF